MGSKRSKAWVAKIANYIPIFHFQQVGCLISDFTLVTYHEIKFTSYREIDLRSNFLNYTAEPQTQMPSSAYFGYLVKIKKATLEHFGQPNSWVFGQRCAS